MKIASTISLTIHELAFIQSRAGKEAACALAQRGHQQGGNRQHEQGDGYEYQRGPPGHARAGELGADRDRRDDVGGEDAEEQEPEFERKARSGLLKLAHPFGWFGLVALEVDVER